MSFLSFLFVEVKSVKINSTLFPMAMVLAIRFLANNKEFAVGAYGHKRVWNVIIEVNKKRLIVYIL